MPLLANGTDHEVRTYMLGSCMLHIGVHVVALVGSETVARISAASQTLGLQYTYQLGAYLGFKMSPENLCG